MHIESLEILDLLICCRVYSSRKNNTDVQQNHDH